VTDRDTARWVPAFLSLAAVWGCSFLFIKVAVEQVHPVYVTLARVGIGALTLLVVMAVTGHRLPRDRGLWGHLVLVAAMSNVLPFTLFGFGEERVSSVLAGIWNATTPLTTLVATLAVFPQERPTRRRVVGLFIGFAGVLTVLGVWRGVGGAALTGQLMCFGSAVCYGVSFPYIRRFVAGRAESGVSISAAQMMLATAQMAVIAPLVAGRPVAVTDLKLSVILSLCALGAFGTGVAFVLNYRVIRVAGASTASTVTYLLPIFATVAGVVVLGERLTWYEPVGAAVILLGVAVSQGVLGRLPLPGRRARASPATAAVE
jgi:drug/metabolite transporter (DMT)-like permease